MDNLFNTKMNGGKKTTKKQTPKKRISTKKTRRGGDGEEVEEQPTMPLVGEPPSLPAPPNSATPTNAASMPPSAAQANTLSTGPNMMNQAGGKKGKGKKGGVNIAPFISALAILGTRLLNDKKFMQSAKLKLVKNKSGDNIIKSNAAFNGGNNGEVTPGINAGNLLTSFQEQASNLLGNALNQNQSQAQAGGKKTTKKRCPTRK